MWLPTSSMLEKYSRNIPEWQLHEAKATTAFKTSKNYTDESHTGSQLKLNQLK